MGWSPPPSWAYQTKNSSKVEHLLQIIQCQIGFRKILYRGIRKSDLKSKFLFALPNL